MQALAIAMDTFKYFMMAHGFGKDVWTLPRQEINNVVMVRAIGNHRSKNYG